MTAVLVIEDGTIVYGEKCGAEGTAFGELVFNTGMTGYQEVLTDPSYNGQIVVMTYPMIGNYGVADFFAESKGGPKVKAFVLRENALGPSNWRSEISICDYLKKYGIVAIAEVDTRMLTKRIRTHGTLKAAVSTEAKYLQNPELLLPEVNKVMTAGPHLVREVTNKEKYIIPGQGKRLAVLDFGIKENILRMLAEDGYEMVVLPGYASVDEVEREKPDAVFLSNGPGDPQDVPEAQEVVRHFAGKVPIFGICLGHQIIGLSLGAKTYKLKFGHRGANHPVQQLDNGRVYITSQNHGYAIDEASIPTELECTHRNLNDGTVEGFKHKSLPLFSVQYHPEAAPGPQDSKYLFDDFKRLING